MAIVDGFIASILNRREESHLWRGSRLMRILLFLKLSSQSKQTRVADSAETVKTMGVASELMSM